MDRVTVGDTTATLRMGGTGRSQGLARVVKAYKTALRASVEEKRLECLAMLQIHRSDTPSIDVVIDRFAIAAVRNMNIYACTSVRCIEL